MTVDVRPTEHVAADFTDWTIVPVQPKDANGDESTVTRKGDAPRTRDFRLADRDALRTRVHARLDGVAVRLELVVLKKNGCLFDLTYIAAPEVFAAGYADFERVVNGFDYPVEPER